MSPTLDGSDDKTRATQQDLLEDGDGMRRKADEEGNDDTCDEDDEDVEADISWGLIPCYPFPAEFSLPVGRSYIQVIRHLCPTHPKGTRTLAIFLPGVHGGVGPCRTPGTHFCENALYPTVCRALASNELARVDCYRCSWPYMRPRLDYAVTSVFCVLQYALLQAIGADVAEDDSHASDSAQDTAALIAASVQDTEAPREFRVVFVGHSLGGAVVLNAACSVAKQFAEGQPRFPGFEDAVVRFAGVCTLNGAADLDRIQGGEAALEALRPARALIIAGDDDQIVPCDASTRMHAALPGEHKKHLLLPGGTHDLFGHKEQVVNALQTFILECSGHEQSSA